MEQSQRELAQRMLGVVVTYEGTGNPLATRDTLTAEIRPEDMMIGFLAGTWELLGRYAASAGVSKAQACLRVGYAIEHAKAADPFGLATRKQPYEAYEDAVRAVLLLGAGFLEHVARDPGTEFQSSLRALTASFVAARFTLQLWAHETGADARALGQRLLLDLEP